MTFRALARLLAVYVAVLVLACAAVCRAVSLRPVAGPKRETITTAWQHGKVVARTVNAPIMQIGSNVNVDETVVAEGPLPFASDALLAISIVAGRDGVRATLDGETTYLTPDDLFSRGAYDHGFAIPSLTLSLFADAPLIVAVLAEQLHTSVPTLRARAKLTRIRTERSGAAPQPFAATTPDAVTPGMLRSAAVDAARFLAHGVTSEGRFRYMVDAATNRTLGGYDWPRHAGAAYFLAQASEVSADPSIRGAALRSSRYLRDHATVACGAYRCVGTDNVVDIGSAALTLIALNEVARTNLDPSYRKAVEDLATFLRSQQRPDGEFMHLYDRRSNKPIDRQFVYYSGEATLALVRAYGLTHDAVDLDAATRGLAHIVGPAWSFFGDRYYFGEEHWTCQALGELWSIAPNPDALSFCERWQAYDRRMMYGPGDTPFDADGAYGVGPVVTPRYTPVASRTEAGVATLDAMVRAHVDPREQVALESQLRRSYALLLRQQFRPGLTHLFADPAAVYGALPGSVVDWQLRIDYAQHAGSAMLRAADFWGAGAPSAPIP